jgi:hypothetical protein
MGLQTSDNQIILPSCYRKDIMTYRYPIDNLNDGDEFYSNEHVRFHVATYRMNEHDWKHRRSCFKHGVECRFCFPFPQCQEAKFLEDNNESKEMKWIYIDETKESETVFPYTVQSKRPNGSQFLNTHCKLITQKFGCNSNVQIGSPRCVFYVLHYATKSTQKEDRGVDFDKIGYSVMKRIIKEKAKIDLIMEEDKAEVQQNNDDYCFREGLSRFLIGMSVHLSSDVISSTMAHLLISQNGSRFSFSHKFKDLLVNQMLNFLNGDVIADFVLRRRNKGCQGELDVWADYSINDYIYRPESLENVSFYQFGLQYQKIPFTFDQMRHVDCNGLPVLKEDEMYFQEDHPGRRYCYLKKMEFITIPKTSIPYGMLCDLDDLELHKENISIKAHESRINYAKVALVLFYPFRDNDILSCGNHCNLWQKFLYLKNSGSEHQNNQIKFWNNGIDILQNMQDIKQSGRGKIPADPLNSLTTQKDYGESIENTNITSMYDSDDDNDYNQAMGIEEFTFDHDLEYNDNSSLGIVEKRDLMELMQGKNIQQNVLIKPRVFSEKCLFSYSRNDNTNDVESKTTLDNINSHQIEHTSKFVTLLGFVSGSLIGNITQELDHGEGKPDFEFNNYNIKSALLSDIDWNKLGFDYNDEKISIPTMFEIANTATKESNIHLDNIQYTAYQIICASFLLEALQTEWKKQKSLIESQHEHYMDEIAHAKDKTISCLKDMGAKEQLIMFITGPAGAGKSTAISIAQKYCFEFSKAIGMAWQDETFLFTAMTGVAAALFGGLTLHSVAHLAKKENKISTDSISLWKNVKVLIIDEISMASVDLINKLNSHLNKFRKEVAYEYHDLPPNMVFGGYHIIFSGDFRQIPPVCAGDEQLLYKNPGLWENSINVAIILKNSHRFKNDPEYGEIMMRMWKGTYTEDDIDKINKRIVESSKLHIPKTDAYTDITYACWSNMDRNMVHAASFLDHIRDFPNVDSDDLPPNHTVIVEADITEAPKKKPPKGKNNKVDNGCPSTMRVRIDSQLKNLIYSRLGDCDVREQNKCIDPALKLYVGAHCMINENDNVKEGRANGTMCRVVSIKTKRDTNELGWRNYNGKKVYYINAIDVEYIEFEHYPPTASQLKILQDLEKMLEDKEKNKDGIEILKRKLELLSRSRRFKLESKSSYVTFDLDSLKKRSDVLCRSKTKLRAKMRQFPVILNDATTGYKLQGSSKNQIILQSLDYGTSGWIYTALSRVRKLVGLFLCEKINFRKFALKDGKTRRDLAAFDDRIKTKIPVQLR